MDYQKISSKPANNSKFLSFSANFRIIAIRDTPVKIRGITNRMKYRGWNTRYLQIKKDYIRETPRVESNLAVTRDFIWNFFYFPSETLSFSLNIREGKKGRGNSFLEWKIRADEKILPIKFYCRNNFN